MDRQRYLHYFTKLLVDLLFYSGIIICALVPFLINRFAYLSDELPRVIPQTTIVLMVSGVLAVYILWEIRSIFRTLVKDANPFILANVQSLRRMGMASFLISITYIIKCFFWFTMATALIVIAFAIAALFCLVLADVFEQAVYYKEENDLTV